VKQNTSFYESSGKIFIKGRAELETMAFAGRMASECLECGDCAERCPWDVDAPAAMAKAAEVLE